MFSAKKILDICSSCGNYVNIEDGVCVFCGMIIGKETDRKYAKEPAKRIFHSKIRSTDR